MTVIAKRAAIGLAALAALVPPAPAQPAPRAAPPRPSAQSGTEAPPTPPAGEGARTLISPRRQYTIRTEPKERDSDTGEPPVAAAPSLRSRGQDPDLYRGTDRRAAKTSIASAPVETFADLKDLIASLPADRVMIARRPPISTAATSDRVAPERRNVRLRAWLYAASKEADNDYHLILGRDPTASGSPVYMTMELSGLPPPGSASLAKLSAARSAFKSFFGKQLPGTNYDFYAPPIPVEVEGSLFFDVTHARGSRPGPASLRPQMPTIWEVHPITRIAFEP